MDTKIKVGVMITDLSKLLLIKEWSENKNEYRWNIIKGTFDFDLDKNLVECAKREAKEEVGVLINLEKLVSITIKYGFNVRLYVNFIASVKKGKPHLASKAEQSSRKENITETKWFTRKQLKPMKEDNFINDVVFETVDKWIKKETYPLKMLTEKNLKS